MLLLKSVVSIDVCFNDFRKNQRSMTKILSRKCNSLVKDGELQRSKKKKKNRAEQHELRIVKKKFQGKRQRIIS